MKQRLFLFGVVALCACGSDSNGDLCTKAGNVGTAITNKVAACNIPNAGAVIPSGSSCTSKLASCTAADQTALNSVLDCLNSAVSGPALTVAQCTPSALDTLEAQLDACTDSSHLGALSSACKTAMGFDSSSSSGTLGAGSCTYAVSSTGGGLCVQLVGIDMTASLCSAFNQAGLVFTYSPSACASQVGGQNKLGTCSISASGVTAKEAIYGTSATDAQTQCGSQGGTWAAGG